MWNLRSTKGEWPAKIVCEGVSFIFHHYLCAKSEFFDAAFNRGFKESIEKVLHLPEDNKETIHRVLVFLYTGNYSEDDHWPTIEADHGENGESNEKSIIDTLDRAVSVHLKVYIAADKFGILSLKSRALWRIIDWAITYRAQPDFLKLILLVPKIIHSHDDQFFKDFGDFISIHLGDLYHHPEIRSFIDSRKGRVLLHGIWT